MKNLPFFYGILNPTGFHYIVQFPKSNAEKWLRTNNVCEGFNSHFKTYIGKAHPGCGFFILKLKNLESELELEILMIFFVWYLKTKSFCSKLPSLFNVSIRMEWSKVA